jgi:inner membrane protein
VLPPSHVAYTWLALTVAQDTLDLAPDADYRLVALAAMGSDLVDKPLAWAYFYRRYRAAVLFAHTFLFYAGVVWLTLGRLPHLATYSAAILGHALLDRIWYYPATFYWPLRGWRFHVWRKEGSEQAEMKMAYWHAFTRRPELWGWELGGLLALALVVWRHRLYRPKHLAHFVLTGRPLR